MNTSVARKGFIGVAMVLAALSVSLGVGNHLAADDSWVIQNIGRTRAVIMAITPAILIVTGLVINLRWRLLGGGMALVGTVALAVLMLWTILIPILAALAVVLWAIAYRSSRGQATIA